MNYYDAVLLLVPFVFAVVAGATYGAGAASMAAPVGALAVLPLVGHALFVRGPGTGTGTATAEEPTPSGNSGAQAAD